MTEMKQAKQAKRPKRNDLNVQNETKRNETGETTVYSPIWQMAWQLKLSSMLYIFIEHALSTDDSARYIRTLL